MFEYKRGWGKMMGGKKHFLCKMYFVVCSQGLHFPFNSWDNFQGFLQHSIYCTSPASEAWIWVKIVSNRSEASEAVKPFKRNVFPLRDSSATKVQVLSLSFLNAGLFQPPKYLLSLYIYIFLTNRLLICYTSIKSHAQKDYFGFLTWFRITFHVKWSYSIDLGKT